MHSGRVTYRLTADRLADLGGLRITGTAYRLTVETVSPAPDATVTVTGPADQLSAVLERAGAPGEAWAISLPETETSAIISPSSVVQMGGATARTAPRIPLHVRARLPRGSGLTVKQTTGAIRTLGYLGGVHITGTHSEVDIEAAGRVTVNTASGDVSIVRADAATGSTVSGDIDITHTRTATLTSTSGDLHAGACADGTITARSVSGYVTVHRRGHTVMATATSVSGGTAVY